MTIGSPFFILFTLIAVSVWRGIEALPRQWRLAAINLVFVSTFVSSIGAALPFLVFAVGGYLAICCASRFRHVSVWLMILPVVVLFVFVKQYSFLPEKWVFNFTTIGLSYLLFRIVHLMVDVHQDNIAEPPDPIGYMNYIFFFLTFVSGPIMRYQDHAQQLRSVSAPLTDHEIRASIERIVIGLIKVLLIATVADRVMLGWPSSFDVSIPMTEGVFALLPDWLHSHLVSPLTSEPATRLAIRYLMLVVAFLIFLYFNFSGYMDIVVGVGRLFGFRIAENFRQPFRASNFLDLWSRWHITLSNWFKTYLFNPMLKALIERFGPTRAAYFGVACFFLTFLVMGIWHGTTSAFLVYGVLLGLGVGANRLFRVLLAQLFSRARLTWLDENALYKLAARSMMISYFSMSLTCLWMSTEQLRNLAQIFGVPGLIKLYVLMVLGTFVAVAVWDTVMGWFQKLEYAFVGSVLIMFGGVILLVSWGNVLGATGKISAALGLSLPDYSFAILGGLVLVFAVSLVGSRQGKTPPTLATMSVWVVLTVLATLVNPGAIPEFVYQGF